MTWCAGRPPSRPAPCPTYALTRASGDPLYTLVNPCDDALMKITHVLRGEDLLPSTPAPAGAVSGADPDRGSRADSRNSPTCQRYWGRAPRNSRNATRSRICSRTATAASSPKDCSIILRCSAGRSPTTTTCSVSTRWWPRSTSSTSTPIRPGSTRRRPTRSTPSTSGCSTPTTSPARLRDYFATHGHHVELD